MKLSHSLLGLFLFLLVLFPAAWFTIIFPHSKIQPLIDQAPAQIDRYLVQNFPSDLKISVQNGRVSTNYPSPYCLIIDPQSNLGVVFDDQPAAPQDYVTQYQHLCHPIALVASDYVIYPDESESFKIQKLSSTFNLEVNRLTIQSFVDTSLPLIISVANRAYYVLPFLLASFLYLFFLSNNLWYAYVTKAVGKLFGNYLDFKTAYANSLFIYTLLIFIDTVVITYLFNQLFHANASISFPFFNTIVIAILSNLMVKYAPPESQPANPDPVSLPPSPPTV
jgi:hypothetical protein